jgi:hypothetical protein
VRNHKAGRQSEAPDREIEPRLNQIFLPLLSVVSNPADREELRALARRYHGEMVNERGMDLEAQVLECQMGSDPLDNGSRGCAYA